MASAVHQKNEYDELHRLIAYADAQLKPRVAQLLQQWEQQTTGLAVPPSTWSSRAFEDARVQFHDVRIDTNRAGFCSSVFFFANLN
jgi:hypothetical protein